MKKMTTDDRHGIRRKRELLEYAEIAYKEVPTQEEMLTGGFPLREKKQTAKADRHLTKDIDDALNEAAQQGNIGGG